MPHPTEPEAKILLDRERTMRMDFNALAIFREITGKVWGSSDDDDPAAARALLYSLLKDEDPALTLQQVGRMMHPGNAAYIRDRLEELARIASPPPEEGAPSPDPPLPPT
jgi:hypothetical protein